jgi:D-glycero-D-manno-heptose 1,7-bisphosphate phosphatase
MILSNGCFAEVRRVGEGSGRPCLLLDRDGVVVEEVHYLHRTDDLALIESASTAIRRARSAGYNVGLVTNQSGIGRGYFSWDQFFATQSELERRLQSDGAELDFVIACPFHPDATLQPYKHPSHPWRKPEPGMILFALSAYGSPSNQSAMVGDCLTDLQAGASAGLNNLFHVRTGHGNKERNVVADWKEKNSPGSPSIRKIELIENIAQIVL